MKKEENKCCCNDFEMCTGCPLEDMSSKLCNLASKFPSVPFDKLFKARKEDMLETIHEIDTLLMKDKEIEIDE